MARKKAALALFVLIVATSAVAADERQDPMDVIVALDKSLSMEEEIAAVRQYVTASLVDELLIPGDLLVVIAFYGKADVLVSTVVGDAASREEVKKAISAVRADGRWTDIGNALDELRIQLEKHGRQGIPKHLLLITDGKPEPPPGSKYWSADGSFTHEFLANTRTVQKAGWKVQVLGLGSAADARALAEKLSGIYTEISGTPTPEELAASTRDFLGSMAVQGAPAISAIGRGGEGTITLTVKSSGYESPTATVLSGIRLETGGVVRENILRERHPMELPASGVTRVEIPIVVSPPLEPGRHTGTFDLSYEGPEQIMPTVLAMDFRVNSVLQNNLGFVLGGAALVLVGLAILVTLLVRRALGGRITFRIAVTEVALKKGRDVFTLGYGAERYLEENADLVGLTLQRKAGSVARLYVGGADRSAPALGMEVLDPKGFLHPTEIPASLVGSELIMLTGRGRRLHLRFEAVAPDA